LHNLEGLKEILNTAHTRLLTVACQVEGFDPFDDDSPSSDKPAAEEPKS
jgi:hypothetical protein